MLPDNTLSTKSPMILYIMVALAEVCQILRFSLETSSVALLVG